jgi:hypothetical protein
VHRHCAIHQVYCICRLESDGPPSRFCFNIRILDSSVSQQLPEFWSRASPAQRLSTGTGRIYKRLLCSKWTTCDKQVQIGLLSSRLLLSGPMALPAMQDGCHQVAWVYNGDTRELLSTRQSWPLKIEWLAARTNTTHRSKTAISTEIKLALCGWIRRLSWPVHSGNWIARHCRESTLVGAATASTECQIGPIDGPLEKLSHPTR